MITKDKKNISFEIHWNEEDECFIASTEDSDLIGCGDTEEEAIIHLKNHLSDESETPRKKPGRPAKHKQKIGPEVKEETIEKIALIKETFSADFESQGDVIDESVKFYYQWISKVQNKFQNKAS
ncbi:MAG: hypothetical protein SFU25_01790 [Candidatus Caenarcaniphilales bacterium]|nr:hypothetical protein [Candidatus Caenarcaniphilales bacterium]